MAELPAAHAYAWQEQAGAIVVTVSTQHGSVRLPGASVTIREAGQPDGPHAVSQNPTPLQTDQVSDDQGQLTVPGLRPAAYRVSASLDGFQTAEATIVVDPGGVEKVDLDLSIANLTETVQVTPPAFEASGGTLASVDTVSAAQAEILMPGEGIQSTLRLLPGVIAQPKGSSIDGGRPDQVGFLIQSGSYIDPATNLARLTIPNTAIDSVSVLPNPYAVEFGRFSSGVISIQTRAAANHWTAHVDNLEPALRLKRFTVIHITGVTSWKPSMAVGGPIIKDKLFLEQTAQYRYETTDIPSRPETELKKTQWFSTLSRVDAKLSPQHSLVLTAGIFPNDTKQAQLGTFTPPNATVNIADHINHVMVTERYLATSTALVESTVQVNTSQTEVDGQGAALMELQPETTLGNFFNQQDRHTSTLQWIETASDSRKIFGHQHFLKAGLDVLNSHYGGDSASAPVLIERSDGTLARRLAFDGPTKEDVSSTDVAVFAQDRIQPNARWYVEFGGRVDHDGIIGREDVTPRVGTAVILNKAATATIHGGYGLFYERTPSIAGAFTQFEAATDTRYASDGVTPIGLPVYFRHVTDAELHVARSAVWDLAYDERVNRRLRVHLGMLDRQGSHNLIVDPVQTEHGGELRLDDDGESSYRQLDASIHLTLGQRLDVESSYVRSSAHGDLNGLINFYDTVLAPVIGANAYAPAAADAPNRWLLHGTTMPTKSWLLLGTLEWRDGLPYSIVNEYLDFLGPRNDHRMPNYLRVDLGFDRRFRVGHVHPWVGLRVSNALNEFLPADVQANTASPAYGSMYNSVYREYRIHFRVER